MVHRVLRKLKRTLLGQSIRLKSVRLEEISAPSDTTIHLRRWWQDLRAGDYFDSVTIGYIIQARRPALYFEIGTGDGRSSLLVAANTPDSTRLFTLDPFYPQDPVKGSVFRGQPEAAKITQLSGFSDKFDFGPWLGKIDLVFVDGAHDFKNVVNDTQVAFRLISPTGWIIWHDVAMDNPGVPRALEQSDQADSIRLIQGTRYAIYRP